MERTTDPLRLLPPELVLRILEFTTPLEICRLTQSSPKWHAFIEESHQEAIYSSPSKTTQPPGAKDLSFLSQSPSFTQYFSAASSWKDLCTRQTLLAKNWKRERPTTREATIRVDGDTVWRFRPDFKRRIILSTSHVGGLSVTDMDDGRLLWSLDEDTVRPFAHLEYQDGTAVWDQEENAVEVWRTDEEGLERGEFRQIAVLPHQKSTRGFQLSYDCLCVVSSQGKGYVYDMQEAARLKTEIDIGFGAVGHLDQDDKAVVYSLGTSGYHFYIKDSGELLGVLQPKRCSRKWHIPPVSPPCELEIPCGKAFRSPSSLSSLAPKKGRTKPLQVKAGPLTPQGADAGSLDDDEWGAGMLCGALMVGISRGGRVFVCPDWRKALETNSLDNATIVECDSDGSSFDFGGWLSVRDHRIMFEIQAAVYVLGLTDMDQVERLDRRDSLPRPSFTFAQGVSRRLNIPVSFMTLYEDCMMTTYNTVREMEQHEMPPGEPQAARHRLQPLKVIRILSLAPDLEARRRYDERVGYGSRSIGL